MTCMEERVDKNSINLWEAQYTKQRKVGFINMKKRVSIILLLCIVITAFTACGSNATDDTSAQLRNAMNDASAQFHNAANAVEALQSNITSKIAEGESLLASTKSADVLDADVLKKLQAELDAAKTLEIAIPEIAQEADAVKAQTAEMEAKKIELQAQLDSLSNAANAIDESKQALVEKAEAEKQAKEASKQAELDKKFTQTKDITITATDNSGNKRRANVTISPLIKVSDTEHCQQVWASMGGKGDFPLRFGASYPYAYSGRLEYRGDNAVAIIGKVSFYNATPDFSANKFSGQSCGFELCYAEEHTANAFRPAYTSYEGVSFGVEDTNVKLARLFHAVQYGNGEKLEIRAADNNGSKKLADPQMESNTWGSVPFVIVIDDIHTPNSPAGIVHYDNLFIKLSGSGEGKITTIIDPSTENISFIKLGKSW